MLAILLVLTYRSPVLWLVPLLVVGVADRLVAHNARRKPKRLVTDAPPGAPVRIVLDASSHDEADRIADEIAAANTGASTFADEWAYKLEAWDAIAFNASLMAERGVKVSINSDSDERARRLYQDAAKAMHYGNTSEEEALKMITLNAAWQLGIDKYTGSIDVGKDADIAIFTAHPFSPAARVDMTLIDGRVFFDRKTSPSLEAVLQATKKTRAMGDGGNN